MAAATRTFQEKDFHFLKSVTVEDLEDEIFVTAMVDFMMHLPQVTTRFTIWQSMVTAQ